MGLVSELRRRNVFRMAVLYAVAAWLIMQVAEVLESLIGLPPWAGSAILGLLAIGFPIALILAWFYELTPAGISREKDVEPGESITRVTGRRMDFVVISLLAAAVILFAYDKWWIGGPPEKSIAVLAFENMSGDPEQEYFSDGISEEILNLLTQLPELTVISRSSAFSFKGKDVPLPDIAAQLNVAHVLEGSVRKAGNHVRITAQLNDARADAQLWSGTYDRTLDDIFAMQDEIATKVVEHLKITLLGAAPKVTQSDPEAYALYLQARHLGRLSTIDGFELSDALYRQALALDVDYAAAWDGLATNYINRAGAGLLPFEEGFTLAREAAEKALAINPGYALAHSRLGWIALYYDNDLAQGAKQFQRALELDPGNTSIIGNAASLQRSLGRLDEAIALEEYFTTRDPVNSSGYANLGSSYLSAGRWDAAIAAYQTALKLSPGRIGAHYAIGTALLFKGEAEAALAAMQQESSETFHLLGQVMAQHALRNPSASDAALAELVHKYEREWAYNIAYVLAFRNDADQAFAWLDKAVDFSDPGLSDIVVQPEFGNIHDDSRWLTFLRSIGKAPEQLDVIEFKVTPP